MTLIAPLQPETNADILAHSLRAKSWLVADALNLWSTAGIDHKSGRFRERLDLSGGPVVNVPHRLMVQCRQIYVFAQAHLFGWFDGRMIAERALDRAIADFFRSDGHPGWVFSITSDGSVLDPRRDAYAHAFVLLALAAAFRVTGRWELIAIADETIEYMDQALRSEWGGYLEGLPPATSVRRQNPHMHLFEAMLELFDVTDRPAYAARAGELFGLFATRLFRYDVGALAEYFDANWNLPSDREITCEPGHHFEWVWLLRKFAAATGRAVSPFVDALYQFAYANGFDQSGLLISEVTPDGRVLDPSRRLWPHAEAVKANAVEHLLGRTGCASRAGGLLKAILDIYCVTAVPGGWIDRFDADGCPAVDFIPASGLYHIAGCIWEAHRAFSARPT